MAIRDSWRKAMVFSGLVDDNPKSDPDFLSKLAPAPPEEESPPEPQLTLPPDWSPPGTAEQITVRRAETTPAPAPPPRSYQPPAPTQATIPAPYVPPPAPPAPAPRPAPHFAAMSPGPSADVSVHRVAPRSFNDAQLVADRFKAGTPVVLDMQSVESDLAKRLIGFASGLTYGLDGGMERLDGRVFLLIPPGVEIPAGQRARLAAQGSLARA